MNAQNILIMIIILYIKDCVKVDNIELQKVSVHKLGTLKIILKPVI